MAEDQDVRDHVHDTWVMAQEAGLRVDLGQIQALSSKKQEIARRMLQRGKADDLAIEPFFLRLIAEHYGFTATESELGELSARARAHLLERLDQERVVERLARHVRRWAWYIVTVLLLIYPVIGAYIAWRLTAVPPFNETVWIERLSEGRLGNFSILDIAISFGPALISGVAVFGIVTCLSRISRPRDN